MTLGGTDLNLIVALRALLEEGNVTRAGERLQMSQPAMSGALAKLRRKYDDELLTKAGRDFKLTPFAQELLPEAQEALRLIARALRVTEAFDPATSERTFRLAMSDYAVSVLHEPLLTRMAAEAPGVMLAIDPMTPVAASESAIARYDAMVAPMGFGFTGESRPLWRDRMVCLVDRDNRWLRDGALTLADLSEMPHAVASIGPGIITPVDRVMGEMRVSRRAQIQVSGWLPLPFVIEGSQMVAVVPERLSRLHTREGGRLVQVEPPFGRVLLVEGYWFAAHRLDDPAHRWLFARLDEVAAELRADDPA